MKLLTEHVWNEPVKKLGALIGKQVNNLVYCQVKRQVQWQVHSQVSLQVRRQVHVLAYCHGTWQLVGDIE